MTTDRTCRGIFGPKSPVRGGVVERAVSCEREIVVRIGSEVRQPPIFAVASQGRR